MIGNRLIFGQQNLLSQTNDLNIYNDSGQYKDAGLVLGANGSQNLRLSYNTNESTGHLVSNKLSIDAGYISMPNISPSYLSDNPFSFLVIDSSGNLAIGYPQFVGDINQTINTINSNINTIDKTLVNLSSQINTNNTSQSNTSNIEMIWIYGLCFLLLLLIGFVIYQFIFNSRQQNIILSMKKELDKLKITPDEKGFEESLYGKPKSVQTPQPTQSIQSTQSTQPTQIPTQSRPNSPSSRNQFLDDFTGKKKLYDYIINQL